MTTHLTFMQQFIFKRCPILMLITRETWGNLLSMTETSGWLRYWFSSPHPNSVLILTVIKKTAIWDRLSLILLVHQKGSAGSLKCSLINTRLLRYWDKRFIKYSIRMRWTLHFQYFYPATRKGVKRQYSAVPYFYAT